MAHIDPLSKEIHSVLRQVEFELKEIEKKLDPACLEASVKQDLDCLLAEYEDVLKKHHPDNYNPEIFKTRHFPQLKSKKELSLNKAKKKLLSLRNQMQASFENINMSFPKNEFDNGQTHSL
jgi:hypothetical protein